MRSHRYHVVCGLAFALTGCMNGQAETDGIQADEAVQAEASFAIGDADARRTGLACQTAVNTDIDTDVGTDVGTDVETAGETDVARMRYNIKRVPCFAGEDIPELKLSITEDLLPMLLPGGIPAFENGPLDEDSAHPFADHFEALPPGCYDVAATPLQADGYPSEECATAYMSDIQVNEGETTEIFLINQCSGTSVGALDSITALNEPPSLRDLTLTPSKFITTCDKLTACATAIDPNGDPVEFVWREATGCAVRTSVVYRHQEGIETTECISVGPGVPGQYIFTVEVYDLLHSEEGGVIRFERWLREQGYPNTSHAALWFPVYVGL